MPLPLLRIRLVAIGLDRDFDFHFRRRFRRSLPLYFPASFVGATGALLYSTRVLRGG